MTTLLTILHVTVCLFLMLTVLLQSGKSGGMGAAFGGGNAATVFGGSGASSFLRRLTAGAATIFMLASMTLAFIASHNSGDALEKFGASEQEKATAKEKDKERALSGSGMGSGSGSATAPTMMPPVSSSMGATPEGSDAAQPTTGTTPILGSGYAPGPATNPTPAPNSTGPANPPTVEHPTPKKVDGPAIAPSKTEPKAPAPAPKAAPSPAPAAVTPTAGSAQ